MLPTMRRHQGLARQTLLQAEAILIRGGELEVVDLEDIRARLIVQLGAYTEFKHSTVFPELMASTDQVVASLAGQMKSRCDQMAAFYRRYITEWPISRVIEQRALYRGVALDVVGRLRRHFVREDADVVRLTERPAEYAKGPWLRSMTDT